MAVLGGALRLLDDARVRDVVFARVLETVGLMSFYCNSLREKAYAKIKSRITDASSTRSLVRTAGSKGALWFFVASGNRCPYP